MLRTNIVLDEKLITAGLKATGIKTRRELVNYALQELLRHQNQKKLLNLRGKIHWEGDLNTLRLNRTVNQTILNSEKPRATSKRKVSK